MPLKTLRCIAGLLLLLTAAQLAAQKVYTVEATPNPTGPNGGWVSDPDDYLPAQAEEQLNQLIFALEDSTTAQIAVVVLQSIGAENPKDFATRLFNYWGIGQADVDNGLLILSVMDQRRTEFETGYGMEAVLPDAVCYRIGMQELVPYFREGRYDAGLLAAVTRIKEILEDPKAQADIRSEMERVARREFRKRWMPLLFYGGFTLVFSAIWLAWIFISLRAKDELHDKYTAIRPLYGWLWLLLFPLPYIFIYFFLRRKLRQLRYQPRFSKINNEPMRLLQETEEDPYLEKGQITEEEIGVADYDVWVTEDSSDLLILRYRKFFTSYTKCPKCRYQTYHHSRSQVLKKATRSSTGKKELIYECENCHYEKRKMVTIPKVGSSSGASGGGFGGGGSSFGGGSSGGGGAGVSW